MENQEAAQKSLWALLVSAPQAIRDVFYKADAAKCVAACAALSQGTVSVALACLQIALRCWQSDGRP